MAFGWQPSTTAGGTPGELRGLFSRSTGFHYAADTDLGGVLTLRDEVQASGSFRMNGSEGFDGSVRLGFFDKDISQPSFWSFVGLEIQELSATSIRIGPLIQFANGASQRGSVTVVGSTKPVDWSFRWKLPTTDRPAGTIEYQLTGLPLQELVLQSTHKNQRAFWNSFGVSVGFASVPRTNAVDLSFDELRYSTTPDDRQPGTSGMPIPVFILAGASNARGDDLDVSNLGQHAGPQRDVLLFDQDRRLQPLVPPTGLPFKTIGSDVSLARDLADHFGAGIAMVKYAVGSTALGRQWQPENEFGYYEQLVSRVREATDLLTERGYKPRIYGLFLVQGEADSGNGDYDDLYAQSLVRFVTALRNDLHEPQLPAVWSRIPALIPPSRYPFSATVRALQVSAVSLIQHAAWVDTDDLPLVTAVTPPDLPNLHYTTDGEIELGHRFADAWVGLVVDSFRPRVRMVNRVLEVVLPTMRGRRYQLESGPAIDGLYGKVTGTETQALGAELRWQIPTSEDAAFYRIRFD